MKRTHSVRPLRVGKYTAEAWQVPVKPARRAVRAIGSNGGRRLVLPGPQQFIVCNFCGNTIRVVLCVTPAAANRGVR